MSKKKEKPFVLVVCLVIPSFFVMAGAVDYAPLRYDTSALCSAALSISSSSHIAECKGIFQNNAAAIPAAALHCLQSCRTITIRVSFCTLKSSYFTSYEEDSTMEKRENETLTVQDIKQILNISINAAYNLIHSKSFPVIRIGNSFRVPKEPFYEWMKSSHTIMN